MPTRAEPRLGPTARARACQSIIRIGLLKFLGTDGERMDIHSFGTLRRRENSPVQSRSPHDSTYTDICFPTRTRVQRRNRSTRERSSPFNFVTYAGSLNCFDCRRALRRSMRLCPQSRGNAQHERDFYDVPTQISPIILTR